MHLLKLGPWNHDALLGPPTDRARVGETRQRNPKGDAGIALLEELALDAAIARPEQRLQSLRLRAGYTNPHALAGASAVGWERRVGVAAGEAKRERGA